jgi:signal transduction histidine kinase
MRPLRLAVLTLGIAAGLVAEWASYDAGELGLTTADLAVGWILIGCGFVAWERRSDSRIGAIMSLAGFTWFLGTAFEQALYLHRGPFVHLLLSYPVGRMPTRLARAVVVAAYVDGAIAPLARNDRLTLALSGAVASASLWGFLQATGPARRAAGLPLAAAVAFSVVLAAGALGRLTGSDPDLLWVYSFVIAIATVALVIDLLRARWAEAVVTGLVVDLGARQETATLRGKLARALGDPSLVVGYRLPATGILVDEAGRTVRLPSSGSGREVTSIAEGGDQIAVLIHDEALLADRELLESVAAAARFAVANAALQAEARSHADELEASRRRIVEAGDAQRRRLEQELRMGAERRLDRVAMLVAGARNAVESADGASIGALETELDEARRELREFAQGVHPATLTERGLVPALALLAGRSTIPVAVEGTIERLPEPIEAALFFVCSEALANVAKHAAASRASIDLREEPGGVSVTVVDDGVGGANPGHGSGLRGLADRVEALGGRLSVESPPGGGTRIVGELPLASGHAPAD